MRVPMTATEIREFETWACLPRRMKLRLSAAVGLPIEAVDAPWSELTTEARAALAAHAALIYVNALPLVGLFT